MTPSGSQPVFDPADLARSVLLPVVSSGFRLVDAGDSRFPGVRERFARLALRHIGPKPALVGFAAPGQDPREAALAAAAWAAENLRPNAIQRRVTPGVLVIAIGGPELAGTAGPVAGAAVQATVWTVTPDGRAETRGGAPGCPGPGVLRDALRRLLAGQAAPTIGHIDVAERALMSGRGRRPYFLDSPLLALVGFGCGLAALYGIPGLVRAAQAGSPLHTGMEALRLLLLAGIAIHAFDVGGARSRLPLPGVAARWGVTATVVGYVVVIAVVAWLGGLGLAGSGGEACPGPRCSVVTAADDGRSLSLAPDDEVEVVLAPGANCPASSDTAVLQLVSCGTDTSRQAAPVTAFFIAGRSGTATLSSEGFQVTVEVR